MKATLNPLFSIGMIAERYKQFENQKKRKIFETLCFAGEQFVNDARSTDTYKDRTTNLRSSIAYAVLAKGEVMRKDLAREIKLPSQDDPQKGTKDGQEKAGELIDELSLELKEDFTLIGVAGMEYAAAVEDRGYDVISKSVPAAKQLLDELKKELDAE